MRYAIFSDIHNHTDALSALLRDAAGRQVDGYLCLGDIGIDPCVDLVRNVDAAAVFGNWEVSGWWHLGPRNQHWVKHLPPTRHLDGFWISHAAPVWPAELTTLAALLKRRHHVSLATLFPYYLSSSIELWHAFSELLAANIPLLFHGHTHRQSIWRFTADNEIKQLPPTATTLTPGETLIVGVGSVGQPKDFPKPGYAIFDSTAARVEFLRVNLEPEA